jgi:ABC-type polysaccharide/polyol phosphate transport system ATPase subunit
LKDETKQKLDIAVLVAMVFKARIHLLALRESDEFLKTKMDQTVHHVSKYLKEHKIDFTLNYEEESHFSDRLIKFAELGAKFDLPVKSYSSGMRPRLAFACSIGIDFDVYLIDEVTSVGDAKFRRKAKAALLERSEKANVIMVSHEMDEIRQFCDSAIVLHKGELTFYNDLEQGIAQYQAL